ncbi:MAG: pilus assembly protein TadG-related protein [Alphaproteobacteria bacterium]
MSKLLNITASFRRFLRDEGAATAVIAALMLPVIMGMAGLGIDGSHWVAEKRNMQTAVDAAAIAAAYELGNGSASEVDVAALKEATYNGYNESTDTMNIDVENINSTTAHVTVDITHPADLWFAGIFVDAVNVGVTAEAEVTIISDGTACILSLADSETHAIRTSGSVTLSMPNCGMAVNSSDDEALFMNGSVDIVVDDVNIVGEYDLVGNVDFGYNSLRTNSSPITDPYASLGVPSFTPCTSAQKKGKTTYNSNTTLAAGVHCGDFTFSGNTNITLSPGIHIFDGGTLKVTGGGTLTGNGVSIVSTNSPGSGSYGSIDISGSKTIDLTAMTTGAMSGVLLYQDRNAPSSGTNQITGTGAITLNGTAYFPSQEFNVGGNATIAAGAVPCSRIIARTIVLHGNPRIGNNCNGSTAADIPLPGSGAVKLIN